MTDSERVAVVVNPQSASGRTARKWAELRRAIEKVFYAPQFMHTERPRHATEIVRRALRDGYTRIVSVGGDGTHFEAINGFFDDVEIINRDATLAILPHGTGSDLARSLHIPHGIASVERLGSCDTIRADVGRVTCMLDGRENICHFMSTCRMGIGGEVVERVNANTKRFGAFITFLSATVQSMLVYRDKLVDIDVEGQRIHQKLKELIIANGQYDGGGMHVAPHARFDDGKFDLYIIGEIAISDALFNLHKIYRGKLQQRPDVVKFMRASRLTVVSAEAVKIQADGEKAGITPATVEVIPDVLNVVVGAKFGGR